MICPHCGYEHATEGERCPYCGNECKTDDQNEGVTNG